MIRQHVAIRGRRDAGVLPRDFVGREHDVIAHFAPKRHPGIRHRVLATVHEGDEASTGGGRGLLRRAGGLPRRRDHRGNVGRVHKGRAPLLLVVREPEFVASHLDAIAVENRARLISELHAVHQHDGVRRAAPNHHTLRANRDHRPCGWVASRETHIGAVKGANGRIARAERELLVLKLEVRHPRGENYGRVGGSASVRRQPYEAAASSPTCNR